VAEYYARKREVPLTRCWPFLPETESMTRQISDKLEYPLLKLLDDRGLFKLHRAGQSPPVLGGLPKKQVVASSIRYAALCYVLTKIAHDPKLVEPAEQQLQPELRLNGASVDSQLTICR
jgi:hypothetical protein